MTHLAINRGRAVGSNEQSNQSLQRGSWKTILNRSASPVVRVAEVQPIYLSSRAFLAYVC